MSAPRVSVIMPTFNQGWFIRYALDSIARQTYRDFELIIVNDGSTDDTADRLRWWGAVEGNACTVIHKPNGGTASAINAGIEAARGEFLTWVSSDNLMHHQWLERLVAELDPPGNGKPAEGEPIPMWSYKTPAGCTYGGFGYVRVGSREQQVGIAQQLASGGLPWPDKGECHYLHEPYHPAKQIAQEACYLGPAHLVRRDCWGEHTHWLAHDLAHFLRVEENCWRAGLPIVSVDECLCLYFAHMERRSVTDRDRYDAPAILAEARARRAKQ